MSNIVVIEPYRILQQAIALSLAQEHKVEVRESVSESDLQALKGCDLLVVDGAALAERKLLTLELVRKLQDCATPMLWLEDENPLERPQREKCQVLKKPLEQKAFKEAVGNLIAVPNRSGQATQDPAGPKHSSATPDEGISKESEQSSFNFIDLVDVVGEPTPGSGAKTPQK